MSFFSDNLASLVDSDQVGTPKVVSFTFCASLVLCAFAAVRASTDFNRT